MCIGNELNRYLLIVNRYPLCALNVVNPLNLPIARGGGEITHRLYDRWR
jgi:hypothetical protein